MCRKLFLLVCFVLVLGFAGKASAVIYNEDIGNATLLPGSALELGGVWTVEGSGGDIWGGWPFDGFHYVFQRVSGDCTLEINLLHMDVTDYWAKVGVMVRETLDAGSRHAAMLVTEDATGLQFAYRQNTDGGSAGPGTGPGQVILPKKLQIIREGAILIGKYEMFAGSGFFVELGRVAIPMDEDVFIGMVVCSHRTDLLCMAMFDSVIWTVTPSYRAWAPSPDDGATGLPQDLTLSWRPGESTTSHDVYLGTNPAALPLVDTKALGDESFDTGTLESDTTYYWQIVEQPGGHAGPVWSFKTAKILRPDTGTILREIWEVMFGNLWEFLANPAYPDSPTWSDEITSFDSPDLGMSDYGGRMQGWLVPETDGWCKFWIASDDDSELWLSSSNKSGSAVKIANVAGWTDQYQWDRMVSQESESIYLLGGEKYFIRAVWKEGGGGDHCAVAWEGPDSEESPGPVVIDGYYLGSGYVDLWAYNPSPALDAKRVPLDAELTWSAGEDANSHEVWFGTNPGALALVATKELGDESCDPGPLELETIYYWQIVEVNGLDVQEGDVWYFKTPRVNPFTGTIVRDVFEGIGSDNIWELINNPAYPDDPTWSDELTAIDSPGLGMDNFGAMMEGYLLPETDGNYRFWIRADDGSALYLSTDDDPANAVKIAGWDVYAGGYDDHPEQTSALIPLLAETRYYIRALYKEGGGGDWCSAAWSGPDTSGSRVEIDGYYLMPRDWASDPSPKNGPTVTTREPEVNGLSWSVVNNYGSTSYDIYLGTSPVLTFPADLIDSKPVGDETCAPGPLAVDTTYYWRVDLAGGPAGTIPGHVWSFTTAEWANLDIASWGGSYTEAAGVFTITGNGGDIWDNGDRFHFVYQFPDLLPSGDCTMIARVVSITGGTNGWRKAGVMVRETLDSGSKNACTLMTPPDGENRISFQSRPETDGGSGSVHYNGVFTPEWVKLVRNGDGFTGFHAEDDGGIPGEWRQVGGIRTVVMPHDVYVGLAVTSHDGGQLTTAVIDNVSITARDPQQAWGPSPANGAEGVTVVNRGKGVTPVKLLSWGEGADVFGHVVWLSDNYEDVNDRAGVALRDLVIEPNYDPGLLNLTETYYWAIDEISGGFEVTFGEVWSFTMSDHRLIDDFEPYDIVPVAPPHYIEEAGYTADPTPPPPQVALPPVLIDDGAVIVPDAERGGQVLSLDGDGDYVDCGNPAALNFGTGDWSVSAWIKSTVGDDQGAVFGNGGDGGGGIRYTLGLGESNDDKITLVVDDNANKLSAHSSINVADGAWHNVIGVRDVNIIRVYIDGEPNGTAVLPDGYDLSGTSQREVLIGAIWHHGNNVVQKHFTGLIDEVRVYDYALNEDNALFLAENGGTAPPIVPLANWAFEGNFNDSSGNGFHGTPHGYLVSQGFVPMLAYYSFDDDNGNDYSLNERHGTIVEKGDWPKFVDSQAGLGRAIEFNDDGAHVLVTDTAAYMDGLDELTISAWIKSDKTDRDEGWVHYSTEWNDKRSFRYDKDGGSSRELQHVIKYGVNTNEGNEEDESSEYVQTKDWQHVAMTWQSGAGKKLYIDGVLDDPGYVPKSIRGGLTSGYSRLFIGKGSKDNSGGESWNGLIDEVRVYNIALSYGQIRWLADRPPLDILPVHRPMVAEYMFDTDAMDTSGNELDGVLEGDAYVADGVLNLDGNGDYVNIGNKAEFNPQAKPFSISAWFKMSSWGANWGSAIISNRGEGGRGWQLRRRGGGQRLVFTTRGLGNDDPGGNITPSLGEWHHVMAIRDGGQKTLYIDGVVDNVAGVNNDPIEWAGHNVYIGARANKQNTGFDNAWFNGMIDDVRVYHKALTGMDRLYLSGFEPTVLLSDVWTDTGEVSSSIEGVQDIPVGDDIAVGGSPHWGERTMRVDCNGDGEVSRVAPFEDWYDGGSRLMRLYFKGDPDNAPEDMYVKITSAVGGPRSSQLSYDGDIDDLKIPVWQEWNIDLAELGSGSSGEGVPLPHVGDVAIGLTGKGTVYFDDLRLMTPQCVPKYTSLANFNNDCKVDLKDLRVITDDWLYQANDNGLWYEYYEGYWGSGLPYYSVLTVLKQGPVNNFDIGVRNRNDGFAFRFTGLIDVPADANYTFYTCSDDGSKLYIGDVEVVDNGGWHGMGTCREGTIPLTAGKHPITVTMFEDGGGEGLLVEYSSDAAIDPIAKQEIPDDVLYRLSYPLSDLSEDNRVNFVDFGILAEQWLDEVLFP